MASQNTALINYFLRVKLLGVLPKNYLTLPQSFQISTFPLNALLPADLLRPEPSKGLRLLPNYTPLSFSLPCLLQSIT